MSFVDPYEEKVPEKPVSRFVDPFEGKTGNAKLEKGFRPMQALGLMKPMTPEQENALAAVRAKPWGSGFNDLTYEAGGRVTDYTGSPLAGYLTNVALNAIPSFLTMTKGLPAPSAEQAAHNALSTQRGAVLSKGRELGYGVPPAQANPGIVNRTFESVGGKAATQQHFSNLNQNVSYAVAQREAGLLPNESITKETLKAARYKLAAPYREIAALKPTGPLSKPPFKPASEIIDEIATLRLEAGEKWNHFAKDGNPVLKKEALALSAKADQMEDVIEAYARQAGRPDLADRFREARVALAKNHTVERAMRGSSFDPSQLSRLESRNRTPLSGDLETVMQMYRDFPKAMNPPQVGGSEGVNQLLPWIGGAGGGYAGGIFGGPQGAAMGSIAGIMGSQTLPPIARGLISHPAYQALMANYRPATNPTVLQGIAGNPAFTGLYGNE